MLEHGYIKLYRSLLNWEWYGDLNTKAVFLHLLLTVNIADGNWRGVPIKRGQRLYSRASLAKEIGISEKSLRTAISHLKKTGEVANLSTPRYSIITVLNYDKFQEGTGRRTAGEPAGVQPETGVGPGSKKNKEESEEKEVSLPNSPGGLAWGIRHNHDSPTMDTDSAAGKDGCEKNYAALSQRRFDRFWDQYPKKVGKLAAQQAWEKLSVDEALLERMLAALEAAKKSEQWSRDNGRYRPNPATWLSQRRWEDEWEPPQTGTEQAGTSYDLSEFERLMMRHTPSIK